MYRSPAFSMLLQHSCLAAAMPLQPAPEKPASHAPAAVRTSLITVVPLPSAAGTYSCSLGGSGCRATTSCSSAPTSADADCCCCMSASSSGWLPSGAAVCCVFSCVEQHTSSSSTASSSTRYDTSSLQQHGRQPEAEHMQVQCTWIHRCAGNELLTHAVAVPVLGSLPCWRHDNYSNTMHLSSSCCCCCYCCHCSGSAHLGCRLQISSTSLLINIGSSDGWPAEHQHRELKFADSTPAA